MLPYERFDAWRLAHRLVLEIYGAARGFPPDERFGLTSQTRRAAYSAAANIAEGSAKRGRREFRRYLDISLGSLSELAYALRLARDLGLLSQDQWLKIEALRDEAGKTCWALYRSLAGPWLTALPPYRPLHRRQSRRINCLVHARNVHLTKEVIHCLVTCHCGTWYGQAIA